MRIIKKILKMILPNILLLKIIDKWHEINGKLKSRNHSGDDFFCPCCGNRFSEFLDCDYKASNEFNHSRFVETYKNTLCPNCMSAPRQRIACSYLDSIKNSISKKDVLMFGAEYSIRLWLKNNDFKYTTADLYDNSADIKADIQNMPFPDNCWSLIICNHVLEHVDDFNLALKDLKRVLKKDGILEITVPTDQTFATVYEDKSVSTKKERIEKFGQSDHVRVFGIDFENLLTDAGFKVETIVGTKLSPEIRGVIGPADYDDNKIYICRK